MSDDPKIPGDKTERRGDLATKARPERKTARPRLYKVILHNDDYTTMEFVVQVLIEIFNHTSTEATQIMLHVHTKGRGVCGTYPHDVAETKVALVTEQARESGFPLLCTMEPED